MGSSATYNGLKRISVVGVGGREGGWGVDILACV